jgi:NAD-dependent dihydropyrimidine dehydrogenase PreA subunit
MTKSRNVAAKADRGRQPVAASAGASHKRPADRKTGVRARRRAAPEIVVDADLCKSCGICVKLCPHEVLATDAEGRPVVADPEACTRCRFCEQHCPDFALQIGDRAGTGQTAAELREAEDDEGDD